MEDGHNPDNLPINEIENSFTTDPYREPFERETRFMWSAETDYVDVYTSEKSLMRRFLNHTEFQLERLEASYGERGSHGVAVSDIDTDWNGEDVYSLSGTIPISYVVVKSTPRTSGGHAEVVSRKVLEDE